MVQIIQERRKPSFGEKFSKAVGTGIEMGSQFMKEHEAQQEKESRNQQLQQLTGMDLSKLSPEMQQKAFDFAMQKQLQEQKYGFEADKAARKLREDQNEKDESHQITQDAFNRLVDLVPHLGRGSDIMGIFGGKTAERSGEFTSLTGALESHLVEMVNKGTLSNTRFKYITETLLPKPTDTQDTIRGKLKGLAQILNLDSEKLGGGTSKDGSMGANQRPPLSSFKIGAR